MPEKENKVHTELKKFLNEVGSLTNESSKVNRFTTLVSNINPSVKYNIELYSGIEKKVRLTDSGISKRRRIDILHGNVIIEFENDLKKSLKTAEKQLAEYATAVIQKEGTSILDSLLGIATDGLNWRCYKVSLQKGKIDKKNIKLHVLADEKFNEKKFKEFEMFLHTSLFRLGTISPDANNIKREFGSLSLAFVNARVILHDEINKKLKKKGSSLITPYEVWRTFIVKAYGITSADKLLQLYVSQTYLYILTRLFCWAALSEGKIRKGSNLIDELQGVFDGNYFKRQKIENYHDKDFFYWLGTIKNKRISELVEALCVQILDYDVKKIDTDIFKGIYQDLILIEDRGRLGEFYTPQWLCDLLVEKTLKNNISQTVLDPACGSGGFLYSSLKCKLINAKKGYDLQDIVSQVIGFDINPLAVNISKTNILLAFSNVIKVYRKPISLRIYLANTLFSPSRPAQMELGGEGYYRYETEIGTSFDIGVKVLESNHFDQLIEICSEIAQSLADGNKEDINSLKNYIKKQLPNAKDLIEITKQCFHLAKQMMAAIQRKQNGIWKYVFQNAHKPWMLNQAVDLILANPPWTALKHIQSKLYQDAVASLTKHYALCSGGKLNSNFELATLFLAHCVTKNLINGGNGVFIVPKTVFNGDQHHNLRIAAYGAEFTIKEIYDLEPVKDLFNIPCCVLFVKKEYPIINQRLNKLKVTDLTRVKNKTFEKPGLLETRYLGTHTAITTKQFGSATPKPPSFYLGKFLEGATLVPINFYFAEDINDQKTGKIYISTTEYSSRSCKTFKKHKINDVFDCNFIWDSFRAESLGNFTTQDPLKVLLPCFDNSGTIQLKHHDDIISMGYRDEGNYFKKCFNSYYKVKGDKENIYERLNYQGTLAKQFIRYPYYCVYNQSGGNLCAAKLSAADGKWLIYSKLYWYGSSSEQEIDYLVGVLNSDLINKEITPFQNVGLLGPRDIHSLIWGINIPKYNSKDTNHSEIVRISNSASILAASHKFKHLPKVSGVNKYRSECSDIAKPAVKEINKFLKNII